jgi:hypothetical protein
MHHDYEDGKRKSFPGTAHVQFEQEYVIYNQKNKEETIYADTEKNAMNYVNGMKSEGVDFDSYLDSPLKNDERNFENSEFEVISATLEPGSIDWKRLV